ncbi:MAG: hypothetical protein WCT52_01050 [Candidatus Micrarchaeia archaeon]
MAVASRVHPNQAVHSTPTRGSFFDTNLWQKRTDAVLIIPGHYVSSRDYTMARSLAMQFFAYPESNNSRFEMFKVNYVFVPGSNTGNKPANDDFVLPNAQYREMGLSDLAWWMANAKPPKYANKCNLPPMIFMITSTLDWQDSASARRNKNEFAAMCLFAPIEFLPPKEQE